MILCRGQRAVSSLAVSVTILILARRDGLGSQSFRTRISLQNAKFHHSRFATINKPVRQISDRLDDFIYIQSRKRKVNHRHLEATRQKTFHISFNLR